jgi:glucosamine--fructose-6-phosphate aminotransferase (isomerizing)
VLDPGDEGGASARDTAGRLAEVGATVLYAGRDPAPGWTALPLPQGAPAALLPLLQARAFYGGLAGLAAARVLDADTPPHLRKVTRTV